MIPTIMLISAQQLLLLQHSPALVLLDTRTGPKDAYLSLHLKGALHIDLETQLAHKRASAADGGRHPLPDAPAFAALMGKYGIGPESHVVVYDDKNGANPAARCWWMLRSLGHENVLLLDGGMAAALAAGYPTASGEEQAQEKPAYPAQEWKLPTADMKEVAVAVQDPNCLVIDVRDAYRYRGESEPIDLVAGHIPGAINIPFGENLGEGGLFLPKEKLREKYETALGGRSPEKVIVHCGSGVTACHTLAAMAHAGMPIPKLYVGSWSEWSRN